MSLNMEIGDNFLSSFFFFFTTFLLNLHLFSKYNLSFRCPDIQVARFMRTTVSPHHLEVVFPKNYRERKVVVGRSEPAARFPLNCLPLGLHAPSETFVLASGSVTKQRGLLSHSARTGPSGFRVRCVAGNSPVFNYLLQQGSVAADLQPASNFNRFLFFSSAPTPSS